jgi:hypothetical protein
VGYKEFLAVLLILGIFGVEPAGAVEIGSLNPVNFPNTSNLCYDAQDMAKKSVIVNHDHIKGLNKLKICNISCNHKKSFKLIVKKVKAHKYHKLLQNQLTAHYNKGKQIQHSSSHKVSTKGSVKSAENGVISDSNVNASEIGVNVTFFSQTGDETVLDNITDENQTVENGTSINGTAIINSTEENKTIINETGNGTAENETNIDGTVLNNVTGVNETSLNQTDNDTQDSSTKTHTLNTIENAGYALAATAGCFAVGIAVAPEGITKTICVVGAVVCGVAAAACFVVHAIASWFDW